MVRIALDDHPGSAACTARRRCRPCRNVGGAQHAGDVRLGLDRYRDVMVLLARCIGSAFSPDGARSPPGVCWCADRRRCEAMGVDGPRRVRAGRDRGRQSGGTAPSVSRDARGNRRAARRCRDAGHIGVARFRVVPASLLVRAMALLWSGEIDQADQLLTEATIDARDSRSYPTASFSYALRAGSRGGSRSPCGGDGARNAGGDSRPPPRARENSHQLPATRRAGEDRGRHG